MSKILYAIVSPSETENIIIAVSYNKEKIVDYYRYLKTTDSSANFIIAKTDCNLNDNMLFIFGKGEIKRI